MLEPLDLLFEDEELPSFELPDELVRLYGGSLGFATPRLYANFVSTLDGVVAISSVPESNRVIAAGSEADRFVMGLLRANSGVNSFNKGTHEGGWLSNNHRRLQAMGDVHAQRA